MQDKKGIIQGQSIEKLQEAMRAPKAEVEVLGVYPSRYLFMQGRMENSLSSVLWNLQLDETTPHHTGSVLNGTTQTPKEWMLM